jgi:hypothetical protein
VIPNPVLCGGVDRYDPNPGFLVLHRSWPVPRTYGSELPKVDPPDPPVFLSTTLFPVPPLALSRTLLPFEPARLQLQPHPTPYSPSPGSLSHPSNPPRLRRPLKDPLFYQPPLPIRPQPSPFSHPQSLFRVHNMPMVSLFVPLPLTPRQAARFPPGDGGLFVSLGVLLRMGVRAESSKSPGAEGRGRGDPVGRVSSSAEVLWVQ